MPMSKKYEIVIYKPLYQLELQLEMMNVPFLEYLKKYNIYLLKKENHPCRKNIQ